MAMKITLTHCKTIELPLVHRRGSPPFVDLNPSNITASTGFPGSFFQEPRTLERVSPGLRLQLCEGVRFPTTTLSLSGGEGRGCGADRGVRGDTARRSCPRGRFAGQAFQRGFGEGGTRWSGPIFRGWQARRASAFVHLCPQHRRREGRLNERPRTLSRVPVCTHAVASLST